jgi:hypothetical protein
MVLVERRLGAQRGIQARGTRQAFFLCLASRQKAPPGFLAEAKFRQATEGYRAASACAAARVVRLSTSSVVWCAPGVSLSCASSAEHPSGW